MKLNFWSVLALTVVAGVIVSQFVSREDLERLRDEAEDLLRRAGDAAGDLARRGGEAINRYGDTAGRNADRAADMVR